MYTGSSPRNSTHAIENAPPRRAPRIRRGKKMPPGAPEPKLTAENRNFTAKVTMTTDNTISPFVSDTIRSPPLPRTEGIRTAITPAAINAITRRFVSFSHFHFLYSS